ncbi:MAG: DoxX family protein [Candidatus Eremiobacteraeota bacterium]|nr:DoxX family protein [Candidatus Eremiobacteraeota bacterium]
MNTESALVDTALLASRLTVGGAWAAHGTQKYFGWMDGPGLQGTAQMMHSLGFEPPEQFAKAVALTELTGGTLMALGALGPLGPAMMVSVMIVASEAVHKKNGFFAANGGYELNVMNSVAALMFANLGYGRLSVDRLLGVSKIHRPWLGWLALAGGIAGALGILSLRQTSVESVPELASQGALTNDPSGTEGAAG